MKALRLAQRHWTALAACAEVDPELFYPAVGQPPDGAIAVCAQCPVRLNCLDDALAYESQPEVVAYGVWGGLTAMQRQAMLKGTQRRPMGPCPDCGTPTPKGSKGQPRICGLCRNHNERVAS